MMGRMKDHQMLGTSTTIEKWARRPLAAGRQYAVTVTEGSIEWVGWRRYRLAAFSEDGP